MNESKALTIARELAPTAHEFADLLVLHGRNVDGYTPLIGENALPQVIAELEALCAPTTPERAVYWGKSLTSCYPNLKVEDGKLYAVAISSVFAEAPDDLCRQAVDEITRTSEYPPTRAIVHKTLERLKNERKGKINIARAMQREHERRREEKEREERIKLERERRSEKYGTYDFFEAIQLEKESQKAEAKKQEA